MDPEPKWYVAYVRSCQEKKAAEALSRLGVEHYLPVLRVKRRWSDRWKIVSQIVLPRIIFIRPEDEKKRKEVLSLVYGLMGYMSDKETHRPCPVPDAQLDAFKMVVDKMNAAVDPAMSSLNIYTEPIAPGDMVHVVAGPFAGMDVECTDIAGKSHLVVRLGMLGAATVEIDRNNVIKAV